MTRAWFRMLARLLCAIGVSFWSATTVAHQTAPSATLPRDLRAHVPGERFGVVSSISGLPAGVRNELQALFGSWTLDMADPGQAFQTAAKTAGSPLPSRRLVEAACSYEDCLVYYERVGSARMWRVVLVHWQPNQTRVEWGGAAPGGLTTIHDVRKAVLSGEIKSSPGPW